MPWTYAASLEFVHINKEILNTKCRKTGESAALDIYACNRMYFELIEPELFSHTCRKFIYMEEQFLVT